ncbi:MAG TPA: DNA polymerase I [Anaerolineae bacterium]|nr:DNA polymerase I [Anaerolineae bacterium]
MTAKPARLVLIDGHALVYRAFFALPTSLATSSGEVTNAVFGFASMLLTVLRDERPEYLAVAFDVGRTFRHEEYAPYKATRAAMPEEMRSQFGRIHQLLELLQVPIYTAERYEADDVLATLARQAGGLGLETLIVTGDSDTFQLIRPGVRVLTSKRQFGETVVYDEAGIRERYGLEPRQLIDFKGLVGDTSDNVPGVKGIGEKTALDLLRRYGSVEGVYEHLDEVSPARYRTALEQGRGSAFQSKHLVTIVDDVPVALDLQACRVKPIDRERVGALFRDLEFRALLGRLPAEPETTPAKQLSLFGEVGPAPAEQKPGGTNVTVVHTAQALEAMVKDLGQAKELVVDVESTSLDPAAARLVGIALCGLEGEAYYVPVGHQEGGNLPEEGAINALRPLLENPALPKYAHNANYDLTVLSFAGVMVGPVACDTMIAEWLINPGSHNLGLKNLAWSRLGIEMTQIDSLIGSGKKQLTMDRVPVAQTAPYAGADADMTLRLAHQLLPELKEKALWTLFSEVEMPIVPIIVDMQRVGVKLDVPVLEEMGRQFGERLGQLQTEIEGHVGHSINISSTQQLSKALFEEMGLTLPGMRRGQSGHYSTAADVLEKLRGRHAVVDLILEYRQLSKLKGTYVDALPALVNPRTGRVHTSYNQAGAATGRFSSSNPNLQNIPIRTDLGREIRRAFVAEEGWLLLAADYSQVELRILAHISGDPTMLDAFARGEDIHASTAAAIYGVPLAEVTSQQRRVAKMTNFAISYGVTGYGLAERTGLSQTDADAFIRTYFETYPRIREYIDQTRSLAQRQGYVETLLGRRRYFPELSPQAPTPHNARESAFRMAINAPIQGSAADILKVAMKDLWQRLAAAKLRSRMILQVHDELVLEVPEGELAVVAPIVRETMEGAYPLSAPLRVDAKVGRDWLDMAPLP